MSTETARRVLASRPSESSANVELLQDMLFMVLESLGKVPANWTFEPPEDVNELLIALENELVELSLLFTDAADTIDIMKMDMALCMTQLQLMQHKIQEMTNIMQALASPSNVKAVQAAADYAVRDLNVEDEGDDTTYTISKQELQVMVLDAIEHYNVNVAMNLLAP